MTQTVDSKSWTMGIKIRTLNFLALVEPPQSLNKEGVYEQLLRSSTRENQWLVLPEDGWLYHDKDAIESVQRGLSQEGRIDRGSFSEFVSG